MTPLELFLVSLIEAVVQGLATAIAPIIVQQAQQPSTAQDGYSDVQLQSRIKNAIAHPVASAAD
jgi:hypothetical protein